MRSNKINKLNSIIVVPKKIIIRLVNIFKYRIRQLRRKATHYNLHVYPNLYRPASEPFISGDTFRKHSNHIFDETQGFDPLKVKKNHIVFLKSDLIELFFNYFHPKIQEPYILLTHNSDLIFTSEYKKYKDELIIHWFAQNLDFLSDENFSALPIGLENKRYLNNGLLSHFIDYQQNEKTRFILCSFNKNTNPERVEVLSTVEQLKLVDIKNYQNHKEYIQKMSQYKFNISPKGNGSDTHRFWESLMVGTFPIVVRTPFTRNMENLGIPAIYLNSWSELVTYNPEKLDEVYTELIKQNSIKFMLLEYWKETIKEKMLY
mgnify:CR=1 FL=1